MKSLMLATAISLFPALAMAAGTHDGGHGEHVMGAPAAEEAEAVTTVEISMRETDEGTMIFAPIRTVFSSGSDRPPCHHQ